MEHQISQSNVINIDFFFLPTIANKICDLHLSIDSSFGNAGTHPYFSGKVTSFIYLQLSHCWMQYQIFFEVGWYFVSTLWFGSYICKGRIFHKSQSMVRVKREPHFHYSTPESKSDWSDTRLIKALCHSIFCTHPKKSVQA